jgi:pentose-5-phosphate-3-epimerase
MHILPSLLEYSYESLQAKLFLIKANLNKFYALTQQVTVPQLLHLHLDFVLPQFAQDRSLMTSLELSTVLEILSKNLASEKLSLTIHLMGSLTDLVYAYGFFQIYELCPHWRYQVFVESRFLSGWENLAKQKGFQLGSWYDLGDWSKVEKFATNNLLMTVKAGSSGQKPLAQDKILSLKKAQQHSTQQFIVDGGWTLEDLSSLKNSFGTLENTAMVSYTSFWSEFEK